MVSLFWKPCLKRWIGISPCPDAALPPLPVALGSVRYIFFFHTRAWQLGQRLINLTLCQYLTKKMYQLIHFIHRKISY